MTPRAILPKDEQSSNGASGPAKASKRKAVSSACIPCRKRKSKCDGGLPSCSTCTAVYRTECEYDQDTDHRRKGALRKDIQSLQVKNNAMDVIVSSLRAMPEVEATALFQSIRRGESLDALAESIGAGNADVSLRTLDADLSEHIGTPGTSFHASTPHRSTESSRSPIGGRRKDSQSQDASMERAGSWFRVPQDSDLVEHLMNLYFAWSHPHYVLFSKDHFLKDMSKGRTEYCSPLLVNAILALACTFSDRPAARTDPSRPETAGDHFFKEAMYLLSRADEACLTTIQALAVMSIREAAAGREHHGYRLSGRCMRMAMELGLHLKEPPCDQQEDLRPVDIEIRKITFWGIFNLEVECCMCLGRPSSLTRNAISVDKPVSTDKTDSHIWHPYTDVNLPVSPGAQHPMKCLLYAQHLSKLSEIANEVNLNLYAPKERFTARRLAAAYNQYQAWYSELPEIFHLQNTVLPQVVVLHMWYYMCVLHLFRPFMKLDLSSVRLYPREISTYCAIEISNLMGALRGMYGLRRVPLSAVAILCSAAIVHTLNLPEQTAAVHLKQALQDLNTISGHHRYAFSCIEIIHRLARQWSIQLPESTKYLSPFRSVQPTDMTAPYMPMILTQATLSNEPTDNMYPGDQSRHDSAGVMYEPTFVQHSYAVLPQHGPSSSAHEYDVSSMRSNSQGSHGYPSSTMGSTPVMTTQTMWPTYPSTQMIPTDVRNPDYQTMSDSSSFGFYAPMS